ncbi:MAG: FIG111991: hypothetical protein, partial [uncultured Acetobacteraceae bacterium]
AGAAPLGAVARRARPGRRDAAAAAGQARRRDPAPCAPRHGVDPRARGRLRGRDGALRAGGSRRGRGGGQPPAGGRGAGGLRLPGRCRGVSAFWRPAQPAVRDRPGDL